jgi:serine/threonine-protein phosphatase 6 regulatory ankyrin repeat subunit B
MWLLSIILAVFALSLSSGESTRKSASGKSSRSGSRGQKSYFFLQDNKDGLCLFDGSYKRCGSDTLWYVTGPSGNYNMHRGDYPENSKAMENVCLSRAECDSPKSIGDESVGLTTKSCSNCGAAKWDILGDATQGYVLVQDGANCLGRDNSANTEEDGNNSNSNSSYLHHCDNGYTTFNLHFISAGDIKAMDTDSARMIHAAERGDAGEVTRFVTEGGVDVNSLDWHEQTALMAASSKGHLDLVRLLLEGERPADVNLSDRDSVTALMEAASGGHLEVVKLLVASGADAEAAATSGVTSLWLAASQGHDAVVRFLLEEASVPADALRADGVSALLAAATEAHAGAVQLLLEAGAPVDARDRDDITPLISAAEKGHIDVARVLLAHKAATDVLSTTEFSPLILASAHGHTEIAEMLLKAGAAADLSNKDNVTAVMYAASGGHADIVQMLIKAKSDVNKIHSHGGSALFEAATNGSAPVVRALLAAKADALVKDHDGVTTVMTAASQGHTEACELLVAKGVDVNHISASGGTALMFAAVGGYSETVKFLLGKGSDATVQVAATPEYIKKVAQELLEGKEDVEEHKEGLDALMLAAQNGHIECVRHILDVAASSSSSSSSSSPSLLLRQVDAEGMTALSHAVKGKFFEVAMLLLAQPDGGADPNGSFVDGDDASNKIPLLLYAVTEDHEALALRLIESGADVNTADQRDNSTAVTQAAYLGQQEVVRRLVEGGADVHKVNTEGAGPLMAAAAEGYSAIVQTLLQAGGATPDAADEDGTTALMAASVRGHKEVVALLIEAGATVDAQNADGHSALMFAHNGASQVRALQSSYKDMMDSADPAVLASLGEAMDGHAAIVALLQRAGADSTLKDRENHRASDFNNSE